jgi:hypothetical protein
MALRMRCSDLSNINYVNLFQYSYTPSLMKRLLSAYNLESVKSVAWGVNHEVSAINKYREFGGDTQPTGEDCKIN